MEANQMSIYRWMDKEDVVNIYNEILHSHKKKWIWANWTEVDKPKACYTKWSKSEKQILHINAHKGNLEK